MVKYSLQYLPLFFNDLEEHVMYISTVLCNEKAATDLITNVESAILNRLPYAESFEPYHSPKKRPYPYYRIYVSNYTIYYVVIPAEHGKIMEVRRILNNRQDQNKYL